MKHLKYNDIKMVLKLTDNKQKINKQMKFKQILCTLVKLLKLCYKMQIIRITFWESVIMSKLFLEIFDKNYNDFYEKNNVSLYNNNER